MAATFVAPIKATGFRWKLKAKFSCRLGMMATEAMAASTTSSAPSSLGMSNGNTAGKIENKMLPSFSDILWCPDIDGDVMSNPVMGGTIVSLRSLIHTV